MSAAALTPALVPPSPAQEFWRAFAANRGALLALIVFSMLVAGALLAPWLAPHDPIAQNRALFA